ncbi:hypothetical protein VTH8203_03110 [Vibrio thalassae]|uniref:Uncharacterized protein n=1 Tax=Vibrio thalassae TaxID=1243014 RepID=A0A240EL86_9VIBR|nr:hypothetical protein VTH8203_03110 [Vibrio thalassae]
MKSLMRSNIAPFMMTNDKASKYIYIKGLTRALFQCHPLSDKLFTVNRSETSIGIT